MISDIARKEWETLLCSTTSDAPYEFVKILTIILESYSCKSILDPIDRKEILLDLEESLNLSCDIDEYCDASNVEHFCDNVAFEIVNTNKLTPSKIIPHISSLVE